MKKAFNHQKPATALLLTSLTLFTSNLLADTQADTKEANSVFDLGTMTVNSANNQTTSNLSSKDIFTSVDIMYPDRIEDQNVQNSYELFHRMPGVQITQFNQGTTSGKLSLRGFNGEGNINAVKLLIDGIPSNTNDGNMPFIDSIFPLNIDSMEVVRGTNDPRYGLHAIAGSANILTQTGGNYINGRSSYGSFNSHDVQAGAGYEKNGFSQNYFIGYRSSDGYRDHSESDKKTFSGKWFYSPENNKFKVGLIARWNEADAQEAGYLTFNKSRTNPTMTNPYNENDGDKRQMGQISGHLDINLSDNLFWSTKAYANNYNDKRFVTFSVAQQERVTDEMQYGAITTLTYKPKINWLNDFSLETGFDIQQQDNQSWRYLTTNRLRDSQTRDQSFDFSIYGGYLQAMIKPFKWLKITPGFRADQVEGNFTNRLTGAGAAINDYDSIWQPKIGAVITPIDGYSLYGNWGRTFQVAVGAGSYLIAPRVNSLAPSINDGWEIGLKLEPVKWMQSRIAYWQQTATSEWGRDLNNPNNDSINVGATSRQGVDVQLSVSPIAQLNLWGAYSYQEAIIDKSGTVGVVAGNSVDHTPDYIFSAGLDYKVTSKFKTSLWATGQGNYFLDSANTQGGFGEYALLNLGLEYQATKELGVQFQVKNLTDTYWEYAWYDGTQSLHSPGDGIAFYGAITAKFGL